MDWSFPLLAACERHPRRTALRHDGRDIAYAELEASISGMAGALAGLGAAGATVGWLLPTAPVALQVAMALARAGALAVPLNPRLTEDELVFILQDAGVRFVVAAPEHLAVARALRERVPGVERVLLAGGRPADADGDEPDLDRLAASGEGPDGWAVPDDRAATLTYTSGTTGFPKGVLRTHAANAWNVMNSALGSPRTTADVEWFTLPAFGIGMLHFAVPALLGGATLVLDGDFRAECAWDLLERERATRVFLAPTMLSSMLAVPGHVARDLSALEVIYSAYEFPEPLRERALARFGDRFAYMYGLTEVQLTCARVGDLTAKPGSVGTAMGALRLRVIAPDGAALAVGESGEIAMRGPSAMSGYHGRPDETARTLVDGWVRTGDLGRIDADGDLHYLGRLKEMIKTGGFSVDPREVEEALLAIPGIEQAAVLGVPDEHWGEMVVAVIAPAGAASVEEILGACRRRLAGYKVPKRVHELDALPLNATGKVERGRLRERYAGSSPAAD